LGKLYEAAQEEPGHRDAARFWLGKAAKAGSSEAKALLKQIQPNKSRRY
jgi:TPR repeat protein